MPASPSFSPAPRRRLPRAAFLVAALGWLLTAPAGSASAVIIDFGGLTAPTASYSEDGFTVSTGGTGSIFVSSFEDIAPSMFPSGTTTVMTLSRVGGGPFDLTSIDMRELNGSVGAQTVTFAGTLAGGGSVSQTFTTDGICCTGAAANDFETFGFTAAFSNLASVAWDQVDPTSFLAYDNIDVTPVPEPTTALLLGAGLVLLGAARRR